MIDYSKTKIYELIDTNTNERFILSSVLKFKAHILNSLKRRLGRYTNGKLNSNRIKQFKPIADILLSNNYKLNLLQQWKDASTKNDIDEKIASLKQKLENINEKAANIPDIYLKRVYLSMISL